MRFKQRFNKVKYLKRGVLIILFLVLGWIVFNKIMKYENPHELTQEDAITLVKKHYPQFTDYPSNNLPPKSITAEKAPHGWYVQFRQEGSGIPLIEAHCFLVKNNNGAEQILKTGEYRVRDTHKNTVSVSACQ